MRIRCRFYWYDFWVGLYWDRRKRVLYICPVPTFCIEVCDMIGWQEIKRWCRWHEGTIAVALLVGLIVLTAWLT
jgi:hypothetical protein